MSSRSASAAMAVAALAGFLAVCATAIPLIRLSAKSATRILVMKFLVIVVSPYSFFGLAIPAATLVVDATTGVHPHLAAGLRSGDLRTGSRSGSCFGSRLLGRRHAVGGSRSWGRRHDTGIGLSRRGCGSRCGWRSARRRGVRFGCFGFLAALFSSRFGGRRGVGTGRLRSVFSCCCLLALPRLLGGRSRRIAGGRLVRSSSLFFRGGLFLLRFLLGFLSGGVGDGVARARLRLCQSRSNGNREHQTRNEQPQSQFVFEVLHFSSRD